MRKNGRITAYIHLDAIAENFENMRANLREGTQMVAVVKTDGYGHGAVPIAQMAEAYEYIWGFAVAAVSEALELRRAGIKKPILILGYSFEEDYEEMAEAGIRPAVFTYEMAEAFSRAAQKKGICAPVHIAVDTGMSRIGVPWEEKGAELAVRISRLSHIQIEGVFTHFAKADETDKAFTRIQMDRFVQFCDGLQEKGVEGFIRHCSNSAGILEIPKANMDMARAGISIYGIYPSDEVSRSYVRLRPAMELKSHIVYIKTIEKGASVSYGGTFTAGEPMQIATIPVGYGDGYPRSLSNKGCVLIRGQRAPILGRVCMDQFMVDVTGIDAEPLDEVTLLGRDGEEQITLEELDTLSGRFPYEFVCDIGKRVPRIYLTEK
ncbi:MAG: alanine racemase [Lachnospiraceae bacterium]|nr:alanine racemase [Lachnospiraceae bacterium]